MPAARGLACLIVLVWTLALGVGSAGAWQAKSTSPKKPADKKTVRSAGAGKVLVRVDGHAITQRDLDRMFLGRGVEESRREELTPRLIDELIDMRLIRQFLNEHKIEAPKDEVDEQVAVLRKMVEGNKSGKTLADYGYTEQSLREEVSLPIAWRIYVTRTVTDEQILKYFKQHRQEFDGTQVRASHILLKVSTSHESPELRAAREKSKELREKIVAKEISFEEAARQNSEAPSRDQGGDVGFFPWRGIMPESFSRVAFELKEGEVSEPFTTPFGVHICITTDRKPGDLSPEDARSEVQAVISQELWRKTLADLRAKAKIERVGKP